MGQERWDRRGETGELRQERWGLQERWDKRCEAGEVGHERWDWRGGTEDVEVI